MLLEKIGQQPGLSPRLFWFSDLDMLAVPFRLSLPVRFLFHMPLSLAAHIMLRSGRWWCEFCSCYSPFCRDWPPGSALTSCRLVLVQDGLGLSFFIFGNPVIFDIVKIIFFFYINLKCISVCKTFNPCQYASCRNNFAFY